jgi:hypothetical protein
MRAREDFKSKKWAWHSAWSSSMVSNGETLNLRCGEDIQPRSTKFWSLSDLMRRTGGPNLVTVAQGVAEIF